MARRYELYVLAQYLTSSLRSLVRYCSRHSNIKFISSRHRVISSMYLHHVQVHWKLTKWPALPSWLDSLVEYSWSSVRSTILRYQSLVRVNVLHSDYTNTRCSMPAGKGDTNQSLIRGGSAQRFNPLHFYIPFWQKRYPFYISLIGKGTPFTYLL